MSHANIHAVTGAFCYSGKYIAERLLAEGKAVITREEIAGLMQNLLYVEAPPAGTTRLTDWARQRKATLGLRYTSELGHRVDRRAGYQSN